MEFFVSTGFQISAALEIYRGFVDEILIANAFGLFMAKKLCDY